MPISAEPAVKMTADEFRRFTKSVYDDGYGDGYFEGGKGSGLAKAPEADCNYDFERSVSKCYIDKALTTFANQEIVTCVYCSHAYPPGTPTANHPLLTEHIAQCEKHPMRSVAAERDALLARLAEIATILETAVCTKGCDKGVILLSDHGTTHVEAIEGRSVNVYDHEYFSPLGDALIATWELAKGGGDAK